MNHTRCKREDHEAIKVNIDTWIANVKNIREAESGDANIKLVIGECAKGCRSTLGFEIFQ